MKARSFLFIILPVLTFSQTAYSADAIFDEPPIPIMTEPAFSWSGAYIGAQGGYGWGSSNVYDNGYMDEVGFKPNGFFGGLYAGYNYDLGNGLILGLDTDINYSSLEQSENFDLGSSDSTIKTQLNWFGSSRARVGYAYDRIMPYIAGGVAYGQIETHIPYDTISYDNKETLLGWTAGAGIDYAATDNIILRLEYRYTDYGKQNVNFDNDVYRQNFKTNDVRLGIAYKF